MKAKNKRIKNNFSQRIAASGLTLVTASSVLINIPLTSHQVYAENLPAQLTSHLEFQTLTGTTQTFIWNKPTDAKSFKLSIYKGSDTTAPLHFNQETNGTRLTVNDLPNNGQIIYVELTTTFTDNTTAKSNYIFIASQGFTKGTITTPTNNSSYFTDDIEINWNKGDNIQEYQLLIFDKTSEQIVVNKSFSRDISKFTFTNLPKNGTQFEVKLISIFEPNENNKFSDEDTVTFISESFVFENAALITPIPNSSLNSSTQKFTWSKGDKIKSYKLNIKDGNNLLFDSQIINTTEVTVNDLPTTAKELTIDLYSLNTQNTWNKNTYKVTSADIFEKAEITSPKDSSVLTGNTQEFTWTKGININKYNLYINDLDGKNITKAEDLTALKHTFNNLPVDGQELNVVLESIDHKGRKYTSELRIVAFKPILAASIIVPTPNTTLDTTVKFEWTKGNKIKDYQLILYSEGTKIFDSNKTTNTSVTVNNIPQNGENLKLELISTDINNQTATREYTYTSNVVFEKPAFTNLNQNQVLTTNSYSPTWSTGKNIEKFEFEILSGTSTIQKRIEAKNGKIDISNLPIDGQDLTFNLYFKPKNNEFDKITISAKAATKLASTIKTPADNTQLTSSEVKIEVNTGKLIKSQKLILSNGSNIIYQSQEGTDTSYIVKDLPTNGTIISAQLITTFVNNTKSTDTKTYKSYIQFLPAELTEPKAGTILGQGTTFKWTDGQAANKYKLTIKDGSTTIFESIELSSNYQLVESIPYNKTLTIILGTKNSYTGSFVNKEYTYKTETLTKEPRLLSEANIPNSVVTNNQELSLVGGKGISSTLVTVTQGGRSLYNKVTNTKFVIGNLIEDGSPVKILVTSTYVDNTKDIKEYNLKALDKEVTINQPLGKVTSYYISLKAEPENYEFRYGTITTGDTFEIYEKLINPNFDNIWYRVRMTSGRFNGQVGWIAGRFQGKDLISINNVSRTVKTSQIGNYQLNTSGTNLKIINASYLTIRPGAADYSRNLGTVNYSEIVQVLESERIGLNTWYKVKVLYGDKSGTEGWIAGIYLGYNYLKDVTHYAMFIDTDNLRLSTDNNQTNNPAPTQGNATVKAGYLTLRYQPEQYTTRIATLSNNTTVSYSEIQTIGNNVWYKVIITSGEHAGKEGWVAGVYQGVRYLFVN